MMRHLLFIVLLLSVVSYKAQLCVTTATYAAGSNPYCITKGDFNSDNFLDLVITNTSSNNFSLLFNNGNGTFLSSVNVPLYAAPIGVCSDDFNSDGNLDLVIGFTSDSVKIFLGNGLGSFSNSVSFPTGQGPRGILSSDINNDGKKDLAIANYYSNSISVLLGNGNGSFGATSNFTLGLQPMYLTVGDFNNDGNKDLASANLGGGGISVLLGDGTGNYSAPSILAYNGGNASCIVSNDLNGDGNLDLVVTNSNSVNTTIFLGNGSGYFSNYTNFSAGYDPYFVSCDDFNGDSKTDLAVANFGSNKMSIVYGNGNGSFSAPISFTSGTYPTCVVSGDFNNDGKIDVAVSNMNSGTAAVFINNRPNIIATLSSSIICQGTSTQITASGVTTYTWSNGAITNTINVSPLVNQTYTVTGADVNNCSTSQTIAVIVDTTCADVWPGDANSDGVADNLDVLELGLHYTQTGPPRALISNAWQSYFANNWIGTITNGSNLNHSDCNGDGVIDDNDTLAIFNNYALTHTFKTTQTNTVNPQLSIVPDQSIVTKGTWGTASIYLGDATNQINNINGIAYTIDFDNMLIEPNSIWIEYQSSFIDSGQNLYFRKLDFANSKLFTVSTHTISNNASGFGKIATLHYKISPTLFSDQVLSIGLLQANQSDASGTIGSLTSGTGTLMAMGYTSGIKDIAVNGNVLISPNPTNSILNICFNTVPQNTKIEVYNSIGALVLTESMSNKYNTINVSDFSSGIYFMKVLEGNRVVAVKKVVKE